METDKIEVKVLLMTIGAVIATELLMSRFNPAGVSNHLIAVGITRLLEISLIILIVIYWGKGWPSIGLELSMITTGIKKGMIWSAGFGMVVMATGVVLFLIGIDPLTLVLSELPVNRNELVLLFLVGGIVGPVAEEVFFRGICYGFFRRWGVFAAVVLTTGIFVLAHSLKFGVPVPQTIGGILFAMAYELEGSLLVPIIIHILGNLAIFSISLLF